MHIRISVATAAILWAAVLPAHATLTISNKATQNITCDAGVCAPTARKANLNTDDLAAMLADHDVTVKSGKKGKDIDIKDNLSWASSNGLTLDSYQSIDISAAVSVEGTSSLTVITGDRGFGGTFTISGKGHVTFWDVNSSFKIDGQPYVLVNSIAMLAAATTATPTANFALANSYDAAADGVYSGLPVTALINGSFNGLGNTISNLQVKTDNTAGLFLTTGSRFANLHMTKVTISGSNSAGGLSPYCEGIITNVDVSGRVNGENGASTGGMCGNLTGSLVNVHFKGTVHGSGNAHLAARAVGGLVGFGTQFGSVTSSYSTASVQGAKGWQVGGLIGRNEGFVDLNYATGTVKGADNSIVGGFIGLNNIGTSKVVANSYATGFSGGGVGSMVGGFIGQNTGRVNDSYSSGAVASGSGNAVGGFIGDDEGASDLTDTYFDTTTSGQSHGVGNNTGYPGVTGLTTEEFQAGLPEGFDTGAWAEDPGINDGLPYLLALPPR